MEVFKDLARLRREYPTAWRGHMKLAEKIIPIVKPKLFVELGTHYGHSFFSFCEGVRKAKLKTRCIAIDTWEGDEHAGRYDDEVWKVFEGVMLSPQFNSSVSVDIDPWRMTFDRAFDIFEEDEEDPIDILHIDGRHGYDDIRNDFTKWSSFVRDGGLILIHDIHAKRPGFGVYKYWEQINKRKEWYFTENPGSYGLGIMSRDKDLIEEIKGLIWK